MPIKGAIIAVTIGAGGFHNMRLAEWRKQESYNQQQLADALGVSQPTISYIERCNDPQMPQPDLMRRIFVLTRGAVTPNDFYDLPPIGQPELPGLAQPGDAPLFEAAGEQ